MSVETPRLIDVTTKSDARGNLGIIETPDAGFDFKRLYFLYGIEKGQSRGHHAHKELHQCMIALHGSFRVSLEARGKKREFVLDSPRQALLIPPGYWRVLDDFSDDAVCLVASSEFYNENDYIRDHAAFLEWVQTR